MYKKLREIERVEEIPKSASGKILRRLLREEHGAAKRPASENRVPRPPQLPGGRARDHHPLAVRGGCRAERARELARDPLPDPARARRPAARRPSRGCQMSSSSRISSSSSSCRPALLRRSSPTGAARGRWVISLNAIGLVLATMVAVAVIAHEAIGIPWAMAFALGDRLPDPVAATSILRRVGAPRRLVNVWRARAW